MEHKPERSAPLAHEIADRLRRQIISGSMEPGSRLVESRLSRELGTSRSPIREAARLLQSEGLLSFDPNRGFTVRQLTLRELSEVFDVRICIERHAAAIAAERKNEQLLIALDRHYKAILAVAANNDPIAQTAADFAFHHAIVSASGNARLLRIYDDAAAELRLILSLVGAVDNPEDIARSHLPVIEAIASGDPLIAAKQMEEHIRLFWDEVLHKISTAQEITLVPIRQAVHF